MLTQVKLNARVILIVAFGLTIILLGAMFNRTQPLASSAPADNTVVGSWLVQRESDPIAPPDLYAFIEDGTLIVSRGDGRTELGSWSAGAEHEVQFSTTSVGIDQTGAWTGLTVWQGEITLDAGGDNWTKSSILGEERNIDGTAIGGILAPDNTQQLTAERLSIGQ